MRIRKRGFAALPKDKHKAISSKGGRAKVPKGFSTLPPEDRIVIARNAANALWEKRRREAQETEPINSKEDGRDKE